MHELPTWSGRSTFGYRGSTASGTEILFGRRGRALVAYELYSDLLLALAGQTVRIGSVRGTAPAGSLGSWLQAHGVRPTLASYVAPILLHEGHAERAAHSAELHIHAQVHLPLRIPLPGLADVVLAGRPILPP